MRTLLSRAAGLLFVLPWLASTSVSAQSPSKFDGLWSGTLEVHDGGTCQDGTPTPQIIEIEHGRLRSYRVMTGRGAVLMTGGFQPNGQFSARGYQAGKGAIFFRAQIENDKLVGRWTSESGSGPLCSGLMSFVRQ